MLNPLYLRFTAAQLRKVALAGASVIKDRRQRLIQLMGNAGRQLAERGQARSVSQLVLQTTVVLFALQALGDVARHADYLYHLAGVGLANGAAGGFKPAVLAAGVADAIAVGEIAILLQRTAKTRLQGLALLRMKQAIQPLAAQLFWPHAQQIPGGRRGINKAAVRTVTRDQVCGVFDDQVIEPTRYRRLLLVLQPARGIAPTHPDLRSLHQRNVAPQQMTLATAIVHILNGPALLGGRYHQLSMIVRQPGSQPLGVRSQCQQGPVTKHRLAAGIHQHHRQGVGLQQTMQCWQ